MPHRRLVRIGETPALPTISQFLTEMASRQHEEIERLKSEAKAGRLPDPTVQEEHHEELTPDPWQLHPVRVKKAAARKKARKTAARSAGTAKARSPQKKRKSVSRPSTAAKRR